MTTVPLAARLAALRAADPAAEPEVLWARHVAALEAEAEAIRALIAEIDRRLADSGRRPYVGRPA